MRKAKFVIAPDSSIGVTAVFGIIDKPKSLDEALKDGYNSIRKTSENIARLLEGL